MAAAWIMESSEVALNFQPYLPEALNSNAANRNMLAHFVIA